VKVYFIPGLGADCRVFHHIRLPDGFESVYLDWIPPLKDESLHDYALRLAATINTAETFAIAGLSMGGMLAIEIAKEFRPAITILISSVPGSKHLPAYYKTAGKLGLHKAVPVSMLKSASFIKRFFTAEKNEDKQLLRQMIEDADPAFISWALGAIVRWECENFEGPYIHIHGKDDFILPLRYTKPTHVISTAGHAMILTKSVEINQIMQETLLTTMELQYK
jgi:pimeloyl-ACP methyl ester carboxylesterase